jgi:hypothetical protein
MSSTSFANGVTLTDEDWFNDVNRLHYEIFDDPASIGPAHTAFFSVTVGSAVTFANLQALSFSVSAGSANALAIKDASLSSVAGLAVATQAIMEAASSTTNISPPGRLHFHPGVVKAWVRFDGTATSVTSAAGYGISSITDVATGIYTVNYTTAFSVDAGYAPIVSSDRDGSTFLRSVSAGSATILCTGSLGTAEDAAVVSFIALGDFA